MTPFFIRAFRTVVLSCTALLAIVIMIDYHTGLWMRTSGLITDANIDMVKHRKVFPAKTVTQYEVKNLTRVTFEYEYVINAAKYRAGSTMLLDIDFHEDDRNEFRLSDTYHRGNQVSVYYLKPLPCISRHKNEFSLYHYLELVILDILAIICYLVALNSYRESNKHAW